MISFVHTADLHLDSPFAGLAEADEEMARFLHSATFQAWDNVVDLCIERSADFLLVAGDVYDGADRSLRAQLAFRDGLGRLSDAGIPSFVVHGNHDPLEGWASSLSWPDSVHVFGSELESVAFDKDGQQEAIIHGISFAERDIRDNLARLFERDETSASVPQIGLLHCNVGTDTGHEPYAPCSLEDLEGVDMDYWALGHVHTRRVLLEDRPAVVYPGNPQGRHINEAGPRGCYVVELNDGRSEMEFVAVDAVRWVWNAVDIGPLVTEDDLIGALEESVTGVSRNCGGGRCVCRLVLRGRGAMHATLARSGTVEDLLDRLRELGQGLNPTVWVEKIEDNTRPEVDLEARRQSEDVLGDLLRLADEYRNDSDRLAELRQSLEELYGHRRGGRFLNEPDRQQLLDILEQAESLCVDRLLEGEEA